VKGGFDKALEKLVAGTLRAQLPPQGEACPEAEILAAYVERALTPGERLTCETHLAACLRCQEQVAALARLSEAEQPAEVPVAAAPSWVVRVTRLRWAWAAPALLVVVIAGLWYTGEFRQYTRQAQESFHKPAAPAKASARLQEAQAQPATVKPARGELAKEQSRERVLAEAGASVGLPASKAKSQNAMAGEAAGIGGTGGLAGGASRAISTPSERSRLTAAAAPASQPVESDALRKEEAMALKAAPQHDNLVAEYKVATAAEEARKAARAEPRAGPAPAQPESAKAAELESQARQAVTVTQFAAAGLSAPRAAQPVGVKAAVTTTFGKWRVGARGLIQKADRKGNWVAQASGVENDLFDITFSTPAVGWAVGQAGTILHTTDGGSTWSTLASPTQEDLVHVTAQGELTARIATRAGKVLVTGDGGKTWSGSGQE
jgi:hypothetical protein